MFFPFPFCALTGKSDNEPSRYPISDFGLINEKRKNKSIFVLSFFISNERN